MIQAITIDQLAIIEHISIDFEAGMTVLSGETGAGKSIIIDAIGLLCGGRGSTDYIRQGAKKLMVEGLFDLTKASPEMISVLTQYGIDFSDQQLIIRREINQSGKNTIRINGQLANVTMLKEIGQYLVDIHGQNEHQAILNPNQHLPLVDLFGGSKHQLLLNHYQRLYRDYQALRNEFIKAQVEASDQSQRLSFLEFQLQEIESLNLQKGEEKELLEISRRLQSSHQIAQLSESLNMLLSEGDHNVVERLESAIKVLEEIKQLLPEYEEVYNRLTSLKLEFEDVAMTVASYDHSFDANDYSVDDIERRLAELSQAKRKYQMSIDELMTYYNTISEEIYQLTHRDQYLDKLKDQLIESYQASKQIADELHQARQTIGCQLVADIEKHLADLYMADAQFDIHWETLGLDEELSTIMSFESDDNSFVALNRFGYDYASFYVSSNIGEPLKLLVDTASGGELSRFMLAVKAVLSQTADNRVMIFDEIDTGVSGRVAQAIALKIKQVANSHQVLCITHLPQVAAIADTQLYVQKQVEDGRTVTYAKPLSQSERIDTIAHMISGENITDNSRQLAHDLLTNT